MTIPVRNIYYLLCYAWDALEQLERVDVGKLPKHDTANLVARVFTQATNDLLRRGLDRDYVEHADDVAGVRGRIDFGTTARRLLLPLAKTHCRFDELSPDVLHNRVIRETVRLLARTREVHKEYRENLHAVWLRMAGVTETRLDSTVFDRVRIHRNNGNYRLLIELCRLVHRSILLDEHGGGATFVDFSRDDRFMSTLFERFVRNFLKKHVPSRGVTAGRKVLQWQQVEGLTTSLAHLPSLETDVVVEGPTRTLIIDTKYYAQPLKRHGRYENAREVFDPANINQMFAYVTNFAQLHASAPVEGLILYASTDATPHLDDDYRIHGYRIRVATLDLHQQWEAIRDSLLGRVGWGGVGQGQLSASNG